MIQTADLEAHTIALELDQAQRRIADQDALIDAIANDTTAADLRQEIEFLRSEKDAATATPAARESMPLAKVYALAVRARVESERREKAAKKGKP